MSSLKKAKYLLNKARTAYHQEGFFPMFRRIRQYCRIRGAVRGLIRKTDNLDFLVAANNLKPALALASHHPLTLNWLMPDFALGAGGHMTIFRLIAELEKQGVVNHIYIFGPLVHRKTAAQFQEAISRHFLPLRATVTVGINAPAPAHAWLATSWPTAYAVARLCPPATDFAPRGFYLVQDFEPDFYPRGSDYLFAAHSYELGLQAITAGPYLSDLLSENYGIQADFFDLAADKKNYKLAVRSPRSHPELPFKIGFYARPVTPRRCFELGVAAFSLLKKSRSSDFELHFFGADTAFYEVPFDYHNHGVLSHDALNKLYARLDLGVVFSPTNHSLLPREMMATGLPVLEITSPANKRIYQDGKNIVLAAPTPTAIAASITDLAVAENRRLEIGRQGFLSAREYSWEKSGLHLHAIIKKTLGPDSFSAPSESA